MQVSLVASRLWEKELEGHRCASLWKCCILLFNALGNEPFFETNDSQIKQLIQ